MNKKKSRRQKKRLQIVTERKLKAMKDINNLLHDAGFLTTSMEFAGVYGLSDTSGKIRVELEVNLEVWI